jgi:hypothetical protein
LYIGVGDEFILAGLYKRRYGKSRTIPIIRVGNTAGIPEEADTNRGQWKAV